MNSAPLNQVSEPPLSRIVHVPFFRETPCLASSARKRVWHRVFPPQALTLRTYRTDTTLRTGNARRDECFFFSSGKNDERRPGVSCFRSKFLDSRNLFYAPCRGTVDEKSWAVIKLATVAFRRVPTVIFYFLMKN